MSLAAKILGNLDRTYNYFQNDASNSPYSIRLSIKIGGNDPTHGPVGGIHWHMMVRQSSGIHRHRCRPAEDPLGAHHRFARRCHGLRSRKFTNDISQMEIRKMDCMDCHNRPSHRYVPPDNAVNLAMDRGQIDRTMPWIKTNAVYVLTRKYKTDDEARDGIATLLAARYPDDPRIRDVIPAVQEIYTNNFFPEMKADWSVYPDNIGHMIWPGCFRCHDGNHKADDGKRTIKANDCNACHTILAQGSGAELEQMTPGGQPFKHTGGDYDLSCSDCHTGGPRSRSRKASIAKR